MITVSISLNGVTLVARSAVNKNKTNKKGETKYKTDCGKFIWHKREDGVLALAHKLLDQIKV